MSDEPISVPRSFYNKMGHKLRYLIDISNLLVVLNSATNFIVYFHWRHLRQRFLMRTAAAKAHKEQQQDSSRLSSFRLLSRPRPVSNTLSLNSLHKTGAISAPAHFDAYQCALLRDSWAQRKDKYLLGKKILESALALQPNLRHVIRDDEHLVMVGHILDVFIERLVIFPCIFTISLLKHSQVMILTDAEKSAVQRQRECSLLFTPVIAAHARLDLVFSTATLSSIRQRILVAVGDDANENETEIASNGGVHDDHQHQSEMKKCWLQVIAYIITSLKTNRYCNLATGRGHV